MKNLLLIALVSLSTQVFSQERVCTFGFQMKPLIPSNLFRAGITELSKNGVDYAVNQELGYAFGGVMRFGLNKWFSTQFVKCSLKRSYLSFMMFMFM